ncbi:class I SAM-dependent methyltransferase [Patescibacteria group bacterium]|nr:class I SAM-dependent methyltransferase [Patescibacteria group bacterium]
MSNKKEYNNSLRKSWIKQKAKFTKEELLIKNFQVMQSWEDNYMKLLAEISTQKGGHILELGFGLGISAGYIQKSKRIKSHTIIECHPDVINIATKKLKQEIINGRVVLLNGFWETITPMLKDKLFDGILFDTSPLDKETHFFHFFPFFKEAYRLLKNGGIFTYFSDEAKELSKIHRKKLNSAGFKDINYKICPVNPPQNCRYWTENTIIAPVITKN